MSSSKDPADPLRLESKFQKPAKQSVFEKQKAEAEAKRKREAAETAAVYEDFIKSFDHDEDDHAEHSASAQRNQRPGFGNFGGPPPPSGPSGASRRHFGTSSGMKSGPGSLGMPPMPFGKKRSFNDFSKESEGRATLKFEDKSDDEEMVDRAEEKAIARPTLRLSNLPPGISPATIKSLLPANLTVENVKIQPPAGPGGSERKCTVAIVTLSKETPATDMDAAVSSLQNRYMGYGYYLSLHRHLSSAVSNSTLSGLGSSGSASQPFGAKSVDQESGAGHNDHSRHGFHRGFAPPSSYSGGQGGVNRTGLLYVPVKPPQDIRMIRLINKVIEGVLEHGPDFEALLMSRASVRREERWAWLWDARSQGGVWYRWTLWGVISGSHLQQKKGKYVPLFDGGHAWKTPETGLRFEYTTRLDEFVSDVEYDSSEDEDFDGDANRDGGPTGEEEKTFLNPLEKAKLVHLLSRLPTTIAKVRKGDIARVTAFAITHVSRGADEVVDLVVSNIERPLSLAVTDQDTKKEGKGEQQTAGTEEGTVAASENTDASAATLVGLYVVFERLGMMAEKLGWGRLRAEKWKRSVTLVLNLWEGWCVFPKGKWKVVEANQTAPTTSESVIASDADVTAQQQQEEKKEEEEEEEAVGEPIEEDDVDGEPLADEDLDGEPIEDDDDDVIGEPMDEDDDEDVADVGKNPQAEPHSAGRGQPRRRMRAADMFADSDNSDGN
ncbi:surp module domain-containing protein [Trichoderma breve]|uniref:Surp module domain-containing protein n=1 Tax=Trichoderma breve TaxID=2034170 RepID=A0A9W9BG30_9HYPO|nr:surp module domain-containing protein [Trichoderma breve]KAJ4861674.1 surp module domain-containing protein [Trichoderma breve]